MSEIEFLNNTYPAQWYSGVLGNTADFLDGKRIPLKQSDRDEMQGHIPYYGASGIIDHVNDYIFDDELILVGEDGENVISRNLPLAFKISGRCWVNNHAHVLKPKGNYDLNYLTYYLEFQNYKSLVSGSAQPKLTQVALFNLSVFSPPLEQQLKIAKILSTVDNLIETTQNLIDKYTAVKQGMMADLFTRGIDLTSGDNYGQLRQSTAEALELYKKTELGWVPKDWMVVSLNDFLKNIGQGWSPDCESEVTKTGQWGVLKTTAVVWQGFDSKANKALPSSLKPRPEYEVLVGDVLMTRAGPGNRVGVVAYVKDTQSKLMLSDKLYRIEPTKQIVNEFLALLLSSDAIQRKIDATKTGLAESQSNISQDIVKKLVVNLPDIEEQQLVVNRINAVTNNIEYECSYLKKLILQNKGLMQDLLTGKVRV